MLMPSSLSILLARAISVILSLSYLSLVVEAHYEPKTKAEAEVQRSLREAAYHCSPAVAEFTASRQRSWSERIAGGRPSLSMGLPAFQDLFTPDTFDNSDSDDTADGRKKDKGQQAALLSCTRHHVDTSIRNNTCVLAPEVTEGPYFHTSGHPVRQNIAEFQDGLLLLLDIGVIDVETCRPLPNVLVDIWHANATGFYAGHPDRAPHLVHEKPQVGGRRAGLLSPYPRTNDHETFLRGAWPTDDNGVAQFTSVYPGYYTGRATHIHTKVFTDWTFLPNGTFTSNALAHVGQFFFDDEINLQVDKMHPYSENPIRDTNGRTRNWRDSLNIFEVAHGDEGKYNPIFDLDLLGGIISQGLIGYITMGVNVSARYA